ncbi:NAD(P)H-flavin reductase [Legionella erythra]|uniref:CDP-6-deoxy-delta-3,4-glucoseen reductase n=1 Tax=Legionella erythra TaxID=448 RepID=A0A0W0TG85_LEGER|nr:NAD(P)H-flavin reductase [Legionella erythra]KTC94587.1 CDP-6-deoxy-delta-3,4-glucoseen reductase [Legionella erythra]
MTVKKTLAQVDRVTPLTDSIIELILSPQDFIDYQPGQYLKILCGEEALSFSIANAPLGSHKYELHIRHDQGNPYNQPLFAAIKREGRVQVALPYGDCYLNQLQPDKPVLFIAGGTGFAPIKAMIEQMLATGDTRAFALYWGARSQSDLYMDDKVRQWQAHVSRFRYVTLLSGESRENLASVVKMDYSGSLLDHQIVIAGPFDMVYAIRDALVASGMPREQLFSDAFSFESEGN